MTDVQINNEDILEPLPSELSEDIEKIAEAVARNLLVYHKEVLTIEEAAQYMGLKLSYVYKLTMTRELPHYKPFGKNIYFKRTELENWLLMNKIATNLELNSRALAYTMKKPLKRGRYQ